MSISVAMMYAISVATHSSLKIVRLRRKAPQNFVYDQLGFLQCICIAGSIRRDVLFSIYQNTTISQTKKRNKTEKSRNEEDTNTVFLYVRRNLICFF